MQTFKEWLSEEKQRLDPECWDGYKKKGTKMKGDTRVNNCVKEEELDELNKQTLKNYSAKAINQAVNAQKRKDKLRKTAKAAGYDGPLHTHTSDALIAKRTKGVVRATKKLQNEDKGMEGMTQKGGHKRPTDKGAGLTKKGVEKYRRQNPGSKLQTAVTTPPSKLDPDSKAAKRRKSFCARSRSWTGERGKAARRRWNC